MKLESMGYEGPFSPKDTNYRNDIRVMSAASKLMDPMAGVVVNHHKAGEECGSLLSPLHPLYVVDMVVYPTHASLLKFVFNVALLVLSPEHYEQSGEYLVDSQAMRVTQLAFMGFKVMCVNLLMTNKLMMHRKKLGEYLQKLYTDACKAKK